MNIKFIRGRNKDGMLQLEKLLSKQALYTVITALILISAVLLRLSAYLDARPLWHDEAPIALTVINNSFSSLLDNILDLQKAPLFFWAELKISQILWGNSETALRFFPFLFSIISVFVFYIFSKKFLADKFIVNKGAVLVANILFALNYRLIYFAGELKQYSGDVLFCMLAALFYHRFLKQEFDLKSAFLFTAVSVFFLLSSFPVWLVFAAFIICRLFKLNKAERKYFIISSLITGAIAALYFYNSLLGRYTAQIAYFSDYWGIGFINGSNVLKIIYGFYSYLFFPFYISPVMIFLSITGFYMFFKENKQEGIAAAVLIIIVITASFLKLYPVYERTALYLAPFIFVISMYALERFKAVKNKMIKVLLAFCAVLLLCNAVYTGKYIKKICAENSFALWDGRKTLNIIKEQYKNGDVILVNKASARQFDYYKMLLDFNPENVIVFNYRNENEKKFIEFTDSLEHGKTYWFYCVFAGREKTELKYIMRWKKQHPDNIENEYKIKDSYLLKFTL